MWEFTRLNLKNVGRNSISTQLELVVWCFPPYNKECGVHATKMLWLPCHKEILICHPKWNKTSVKAWHLWHTFHEHLKISSINRAKEPFKHKQGRNKLYGNNSMLAPKNQFNNYSRSYSWELVQELHKNYRQHQTPTNSVHIT